MAQIDIDEARDGASYITARIEPSFSAASTRSMLERMPMLIGLLLAYALSSAAVVRTGLVGARCEPVGVWGIAHQTAVEVRRAVTRAARTASSLG